MAKSKPPAGEQNQGRGVTPHIFELSRSLHDFAESPRYNLLKSLQVGRFIDKQTAGLGVIEDFTFEKLIELGSKKLTKLHWLTPEQTETLVKLLRGLTENSGLEDGGPTDPIHLTEPTSLKAIVVPTEGDEEVEEVDGVHVFSSVEGELKLREVLAALTNHSRFNDLATRTLGTFWKEHWIRAPFEEALTIRQIAEFDVGTLLKKRTMSSRKITTIVIALRSALETLTCQQQQQRAVSLSTVESHNVNPSPQADLQARSTSSKKTTSPWTISVMRGGTSARAAVCLFERECDHARACSDPAWSWVAEIREAITADEFLHVLDVMERPHSQRSTDQAINLLIRKKLEAFFDQRSLPVRDLFRVSIASVGIPISALACALGNFALVSPAKEMAAFLVLFSLNAQTVQLLDESLPGFWTSRPAAIHAIVEAILQKLPLTDGELDHLLDELVTSEVVKPLGEILRSRLDSINGKWTLIKR